MLEAEGTIFFESAVDDFFELDGQLWIDADRCDGISIQDRIENHAGGVAAKRQSASGHFVEDDAKRKQVRARIEILATNLLGRHVGNGADGGAGAGQEFLRREGGHL